MLCQATPRNILDTIDCVTPNVLAIARCDRPADSNRMRFTSSLLNLLARRWLCMALNIPVRLACSWFHFLLHHSRLSHWLFALFKSLWLISGRSLAGRKCCATKRWIFLFSRLGAINSCTYRYPSLSLAFLRTRPRVSRVALPRLHLDCRSRLRTLPRLLTSYSPSHPSTGSQISSRGKYVIF